MTLPNRWRLPLALVAMLLATLCSSIAPSPAIAQEEDPEGAPVSYTVRRIDFPPYIVFSEFPYEAFAVRWVIEFPSVPGASEYYVEVTTRAFDGSDEIFGSIHPENEHTDDVSLALPEKPVQTVTAPPGVHWVGVWSGGWPVIYPWAADESFQQNFRGARVFARRPCDLVAWTVTETDDVPVGEEFTVQTRLEAQLADGDGSITNIDWTPLEISPPGLVEVVSGPTPPGIPSNFVLESGDGVGRIYVLRVVAPGAVTLKSSATGLCPTGETVTSVPQPREITLTADVLDVKVELEPAVIDLEEDEDAVPIPQDVTATVTIKNIHSQPLEAVRLIDLRARPREIPPPLPPPLAVLGGPFSPAGPVADPSELGTLDPGETVVRTYDLRAQGAGTIDVTAYASGALPGSTERLTSSGTKKIDIKDDVLFVLDTDIESVGFVGADPIVPGGSSWRVVGTIENRSKEETLVVQLSPELVGNASYAQPIPDGTTAPDAQCAVGIVRELEPEEVVPFRAPVRTEENGGTRGIVTYRPRVWIKNDDGSRTLIHDERATPALLDDRVVVTDGSGEHMVRVDTSDETPRQPFADEVVGHFLVGTVDGLGTFAEGIWNLVEMAGQAVAVVLSPWEYPERFSRGAHLLSDFITSAFRGLSDLDREQFFAEVGAGLEAAGMAWDQINLGIEQYFTTLTTAWETGDSATVARFWGEIAGENPDLAIGFAFSVCKLGAKGARYAGRGLAGFKASEAASLEARVAAGVRALKPWDDISAAARAQLFGIDPASDEVFRKFAAKGFVLAVRRRGSRAIAKLRPPARFVTKPYHLKAKNVSDIDVDWLGFPGDRLDEVLIKEPPPWAEVRARLLDQEPDVIEEVRLRWQTRAEEWWGKGVDDAGVGGDFAKSERAQWQRHQEGGIPYNKTSIEGQVDNFDKGVVPPEDLEQVLKQFETETLAGTDGREVLVAKIEGKGVTGDIDPMYIGRPDGRGFQDLTDAERLEVYKLFRDLGFQHPESATWKNAKVNAYFEEFSIHNPSREALAMYHPDGRVVAAFFDPGKSWLNPSTWKSFYMFFRGGTTMMRSEDPDVPGLVASLQEEIRLAAEPRAVYVGPGTWALVSPNCPGGSTIQALATATCPCQVGFDTTPDALVLRQSGIGTFERWTSYDGWTPYVPPDPALTITPQTYLSELAPLGSIRLAVGDLAAMGFDPGAHAWFQPGQTIVINPGGATEETATIASLGSLILTAPLRFTHLPRETVAVVGAAQTTPPDERMLSGHALLLSQNPKKPDSRRAQVVSKDRAQLDLGSDVDVAALQAADGWLRVRAAGDGGFDVTYPLPAGGWKPLKAKKPAKGLKHPGHGPITKVVLTSGKQLLVTAKGQALGIDLATKLGPVQVELALGARRYCLEFGGRERFKAGKRLLRRKSERATACPGS